MRIWLLLLGSVSALIGTMVLFGVVPDCGRPMGLHWMISWSTLCRTGFDPAMPLEPSVVYAIPLLLILVVWLKRKFIREKGAS